MGRGETSEYEGVRAASKTSIEIDFYYWGKRCKPRIKAIPTDANLRRAAAFRIEIIEAIKNDTFVWSESFPDIPCPFNKENKTLKLKQYLRDWLKANSQYYSSSTIGGYNKIIEGHLIPEFGELQLFEVRLKHVKSFASGLTGKSKTIGNIISVLRAALDDAVEDEHIEVNPIANYKIKRKRGAASKRKPPIDPFTHNERMAIINTLSGQDKNLVEFAFWTGLRPSEYIALNWSDIDFINGYVDINKAVTDAAEEAEEPKTEASIRKVKLLPPALDALRRQKDYTFLRGEEIFQNHDDERWTGAAQVRKTMWQHALKKAGVRYRKLYNTRHSFASMLLTDGEPIQWVSKQLGHTDWAFTARTYADFIPDDAPEAGLKTVEANRRRNENFS